MYSRSSLVLLAVILSICAGTVRASMMGPSPYLSAVDSPLTGSFSYFHVEDFEDGLLNSPGLSASTGMALAPSEYTDSVDADDSDLDGLGFAGTSWYVMQNSVTFYFDAQALGGLPTHAGLVWTDVGFSEAGLGFGHVAFESFDENGDFLDSIGPFDVGEGLVRGQTDEDRIFSVIHLGGISAIRLTMTDSCDWELDHVQYGRVPEPSTLSILLISAGGLVLRRRR